MNPTAIIYTRVSSEDQVSGTSLDTQRRDCIALANARGFTVTEIFTDAGFSAKTAKRPALQRAIDYAKKKKPAAFIVWKLDRLARNTADGLIIRSTLARFGTTLISATESISDDPTGDLVSTLLLGVAQFDNAQRSIRCRRGMVETALRGGWTFKAPIGFRSARDASGLPILELDPTIGQTMQRILKDYAAGAIGKTEYYAGLQAIGVTRQMAEKIPNRTIYAGIIKNELTGGQPVTAAFPGMITPEEQKAMQEARTHYATQITGTAAEDIFRGLIRCAECGRAFTPYTAKGNVYWKCSHCRCNIRDKKLYEQLNQIIASAPDLAQLLKAIGAVARIIAKKRIDAQRAKQTAAAAETASARRKLDKLIDLLLDERISQETFDRKSAEYNTIINRAKSADTDATFDTNTALTHLERTVSILSDPHRFLKALTPARANALLRLIFGDFLIDPATRTVTVSAETDALYSLLQKTKTAAGTDPAADDSSKNLIWWTKASKNLTLLFKKCSAIAMAV